MRFSGGSSPSPHCRLPSPPLLLRLTSVLPACLLRYQPLAVADIAVSCTWEFPLATGLRFPNQRQAAHDSVVAEPIRLDPNCSSLMALPGEPCQRGQDSHKDVCAFTSPSLRRLVCHPILCQGLCIVESGAETRTIGTLHGFLLKIAVLV